MQVTMLETCNLEIITARNVEAIYWRKEYEETQHEK